MSDKRNGKLLLEVGDALPLHGAIAQAAAELRAVHLAEWREVRAAMDEIEQIVRDVLGAHERGDIAECHRLCKDLLDAEYAVMGDCYSEHLTTLLGYDDPEPQ